MNETPETEVDPQAFAGLTLMRRLVTALLVVMIVGFLVLIGLLVTRFPSATPRSPILPDSIALPEGSDALAVTMGSDWIGVVVVDDSKELFLVFDTQSGALRQSISLQ